jgi:hypothetical protein
MLRIRPSLAVLFLLLGRQPLHSSPTWTPPVVVDSRVAVELSQIRLKTAGTVFYAPALFYVDAVTSELEVLSIDVTEDPPTVAPDPVASGNVFALGAIDETANAMSFSFIDGNFDLRAGICVNPCTDFTNNPVVAGTFVDSASAASAGHHFVAALGNGLPRTLGVFYSANGSDWTLLYTYTPPETGGVCGQFNGCARISFVVDPLATEVATTLSCLTFEVKISATTTERRIVCFAGNVAQLVAPLFADIPDPDNQLDVYEDVVSDGGGLSDFEYYVLRRRQTRTVESFRFDRSTQQIEGPVPLGPAPDGLPAYRISAFLDQSTGTTRNLWTAGSGVPAYDLEWNADQPGTLLERRGPQAEPGAMTTVLRGFFDDPTPANVWALFNSLETPFHALAGGAGLAISSYRLTLFDDSFETDNTLRWSATSP